MSFQNFLSKVLEFESRVAEGVIRRLQARLLRLGELFGRGLRFAADRLRPSFTSSTSLCGCSL